MEVALHIPNNFIRYVIAVRDHTEAERANWQPVLIGRGADERIIGYLTRSSIQECIGQQTSRFH